MAILLMPLLLVLGLFSCSYPDPECVYRTFYLQKSFSDQALKNDNLELFLVGGKLLHEIEKINMGFTSSEKVGIEEARMLFVKNVEALLSMINSDVIARPYLNNYPFTIENINFSILFLTEKNQVHCPPLLACVMNVDQKIIYKMGNVEAKKVDIVFEESYEEALRIYHENLKTFENSYLAEPPNFILITN